MEQIRTSGLLIDGWLFDDCYVINPCNNPGHNGAEVIRCALYCSKCGKFIGRTIRCGCEMYVCGSCKKEVEKKI